MTATSWASQELAPAMRVRSAVSTNSGSALGGSADAAAEVLFVDAAVRATVGDDTRSDAIAVPVLRPDPAVPFTAQRVARTTTGGGSTEGAVHRRPTTKAAGSTPALRSSLTSDPVRQRERFIIATHGKLKVREQAQQLGISSALVTQYRQRLSKQGRIEITHRLSDHRRWTTEDIAWFRENIGRPWPELEQHLRRSHQALIVAAKRLDTNRQMRKANRESINANDVAGIMGVDIHAVIREGWIPWGLLKAARSEWLAGGEGPQWEIRREDLVNFLVDYPWQYDRTKISEPFFRQVADAAWEKDPLYTSDQVAKVLGFKDSKGFTGFLLYSAEKFVPRSKLVIYRKGNPHATKPRSFTGMPVFVPRSTLEAIRRSDWVNYRKVIEDPNWWTAEAAAQHLMNEDPDRPSYVTKSTLVNRIRGLYDTGAIPTRSLKLGDRKPWRQAAPADVHAVKDALYARSAHRLRLTGQLKALIDRHDPSWLQRPRDLALALADGRIETLKREWKYGELRAAAEFRHNSAKKWVFVTRHVRAVLQDLGPKTKYGGPKRRAVYHLEAHTAGWVRIPLVEANRRGLHVCGWCEFERQTRTVCSSCRSAYRRGRGRPAKMPLCPKCKATERRAA